MVYKFIFEDVEFLEGSEVQFTEPYVPQIIKDYENRMIRTRLNTSVRFYKDAYRYIAAKLNDNVCQKLDVEIQRAENGKDFIHEVFAKIDISGAVVQRQSDNARYIEVELLDNTFQSIVLTRWKKPAVLYSNKTLNCTLFNAPPIYDIRLHNPEDGTYYGDLRKGYRIYDVFRYLAEFIFDADITFQSNFLNNLPLFLLKGANVRDPNQDLVISTNLNKAFEEMYVLYNLWMGVTLEGVLVVEPESYFIQNVKQIEFLCVTNFKSTTDLQRLYTSIEVGSSITVSPADEDVSYNSEQFRVTHRKEEYTINAGCGNDNKLTLINDWIIDSNAIEKIIKAGSDFDQDEELILVEMEFWDEPTLEANSGRYRQFSGVFGDLANDGPRYYNEGLMNFNKLETYFGELQPTQEFESGLIVCEDTEITISGSHSGFLSLVPFAWPTPFDEILYQKDWEMDVAGPNQGIPICKKTDFYRVYADFRVTNTASINNNSRCIAILFVYPNLAAVPPSSPPGLLFRNIVLGTYSNGQVQDWRADFGQIYIPKDSALVFEVNILGPNLETYDGTLFSSCLTITSCNELNVVYDPTNVPFIIEHSFEQIISKADFESLKANYRNRIDVADGNSLIPGWIKDISRDDKTGKMTAKLIGQTFSLPDVAEEPVYLLDLIPKLVIAWSVRKRTRNFDGYVFQLQRPSDGLNTFVKFDEEGWISWKSMTSAGTTLEVWGKNQGQLVVLAYNGQKPGYDWEQVDANRAMNIHIEGSDAGRTYIDSLQVSFSKWLTQSGTDIFGSHESGHVLCVGRAQNLEPMAWLSSGDLGANEYFNFGSTNSGALNKALLIEIRSTSAGINNVIYGSTAVDDDAWHYMSVGSLVNRYQIRLDGVEETVNVNSGADDGSWINAITGVRNNLFTHRRVTNSRRFLSHELMIATPGLTLEELEIIEAAQAEDFGI